MAESKQPLSEEVDDMSWSEVADLARGISAYQSHYCLSKFFIGLSLNQQTL